MQSIARKVRIPKLTNHGQTTQLARKNNEENQDFLFDKLIDPIGLHVATIIGVVVDMNGATVLNNGGVVVVRLFTTPGHVSVPFSVT